MAVAVVVVVIYTVIVKVKAMVKEIEDNNNASYWIERIEDEGGRAKFVGDLSTMDTNIMKDIVG